MIYSTDAIRSVEYYLNLLTQIFINQSIYLFIYLIFNYLFDHLIFLSLLFVFCTVSTFVNSYHIAAHKILDCNQNRNEKKITHPMRCHLDQVDPLVIDNALILVPLLKLQYYIACCQGDACDPFIPGKISILP